MSLLFIKQSRASAHGFNCTTAGNKDKIPQGNAIPCSDMSTLCMVSSCYMQLSGNGLDDVWHVMFVLLCTLNTSGLDIFSAYSALWVVSFYIQICCDGFVNKLRLHDSPKCMCWSKNLSVFWYVKYWQGHSIGARQPSNNRMHLA